MSEKLPEPYGWIHDGAPDGPLFRREPLGGIAGLCASSAPVYSHEQMRAAVAEADDLRRERDELAAWKASIEQAEPARQEPTALERELLGALQGAYSLAIGHAATYQHQHQLAAPHPTHAEILSQSRAAIAKASAPTADVPAPAEPQPRPTCSSSGLLGATSGVGRECDYWADGVCTSPEPCQHQQPVKPCRTCGPDGCSDSTSCPRGERCA